MPLRHAAPVAGLVLGLSACSCPDTVDGVRDGDRIKTTILSPYYNASTSDLFPYEPGPSCMGLDGFKPGTSVTMQAHFDTPADGCPTSNLSLTFVQSNLPALSASSYGPGYIHYNANGCEGEVEFQFGTNSETSYYNNANSTDGGAVSWYAGARFIVPSGDAGMTDAGACGVQTPCSDLFIATNQKQ